MLVMKLRRSLGLLAGILLALAALASAALAIFSVYRPQTWTLQSPARGRYPPDPPEAMFLESRGGRVVWLWQRADNLGEFHSASLRAPRQISVASLLQSSFPTPTALNDPVKSPEGWLQRIGFTARSVGPSPARGVLLRPGEANPTLTFTELMVPYWFLVLVFGFPAAWLIMPEKRSRRWARQGRCTRCGYDLRHSPDRCPECGNQRARSAVKAK